MPKKNKIYWSLGVTEKGTRALLTDENSKFRWLRSQKNRRVLVVLEVVGLVLVAAATYLPSISAALGLSQSVERAVFIVAAIFAVTLLIGGYSLVRMAVRGIADAPDELLDERQVQIRNTSYRYAYLAMGYLVLALLALIFFGPEVSLFEDEGNDGSLLLIASLFALASAPSMILAWREKDI
jgi:hypothetical protein